MNWVVYILRCSDGSYYTGITNNLAKRVATHNCGKGSKYVRSRLPVVAEWFTGSCTKSFALRLEARIKRLSHDKKRCLIDGITILDSLGIDLDHKTLLLIVDSNDK